jgi:Phage phiEco32-like COOH.NH2 ligase-type 2
MYMVGCDPELFLKDKNGNWKASCGLFGGSKEKPLPFGPKGFALQEDNVALEFNIPPAWNADMFDNNLEFALNELNSRANVLGLGLSITASAIFPKDELMHPKAQVFGCDPDFNAWDETENRRPEAENKLLRSCGGHVHIGVKKYGYIEKIELIRLLDVLLGIPSLFLDNDKQRRELYGKAGAFRDKPYGVEYRSLSNFWVAKSSLRKWIFNEVQKATKMIEDGYAVPFKESHAIRQAIDYGDMEAAKYVKEKFECMSIPQTM